MKATSSNLLIVGAVAIIIGATLYWRFEPTIRPLTFPTPGEGPAIVALLTNEDCVSYATLVGFLNEASQAGLDVVGVVVDQHGNGVPFTDAGVNRVTFPLRPDLARDITRRVVQLGFRTTPVVLLVDSRGRARSVVPPMPDLIQHSLRMRGLVRDAQTLSSLSGM